MHKRLALYVVGLAALGLFLAPVARAQVMGLFYQEVEKDGRVYVFNTPEAHQRFTESGEIGLSVTLVFRAEGGKTLVGDNETAIDLYLFKHDLPPYVRPTPPTPKEHKHDWDVKWSDGHKMDKKDKAFALKFGGRVQADYIFASQNEDIDEDLGEDAFENGFEFRRARLFFEGTIYERVTFKAEYDFAASGDPTFKDVWIALNGDAGDLMFGHYKEPMSINELTSSKYIAFNERASPVEMFAPSRNAGVGFNGSTDAFTYGIGAFYDTDDFGVSLNEDRHDVTGRFVWRPFLSDEGKSLLHVGGSFSQQAIEPDGSRRFRSRPDNHFGPRPVDTGNLPADDTQIWQLEVAGVAGRLWYTGEYFGADVDTPMDSALEVPELANPSLDGWYAEAGFFLTDDYRRYKASDGAWDRQKPSSPWLGEGGGGAWEVALRFDEVDITEAVLDDEPGEMANITVQLNWYPNNATRLMIGYVNTDVDSADGSFGGTIDSVLVRWAVDF